MNIVIRYDQRGIFLWAESEGVVFRPKPDCYEFERIESASSLGDYLRRASEPTLTDILDDPTSLAADIAQEIVSISKSFPRLSAQPAFILPQPLATALRQPSRMLLSDYLTLYATPHNAA